jgi:hypothetical protein
VPSRRGFAIKELLVVMAIAGSGGVCLTLLDPLDDEQRDVFASERVRLMECEVPLADGFVCLVSMDGFANPDSGRRPYRVTRLRFARPSAGPGEAFLFEATAGEVGSWGWSCNCRTWSWMTDEELQARAAEGPPQLTLQARPPTRQQLWAEVMIAADSWREACRLPEPLWRQVPPALQQTGQLSGSRRVGLNAISQIEDFPLADLNAAIQTASVEDGWTGDDPRAHIPTSFEDELSPERQRALAQGLIQLLARSLPTRAPSE